MTTMTVDAADYAAVVQVSGLPPEVQARLVEHILRSNAALPERDPVSLPTARCAATLIAAAPNRLSVPLALAQALTLARQPVLGPALMHLYEGLQDLAQLRTDELAGLRLHAQIVSGALQILQSEIADLLKRVQAMT
jgi:hypothetical protein